MEKIHQTFLDKLGRNIEKRYMEKFPSQYAFAKYIGCDTRTIRRIIRGEQNVSIILLVRIAESLDCDILELFPKIEK
jgi:transcriptional regulator with XRE-family HTH domain